MATYTFHDLAHDTVRKSSLTGIRAILVLARHDIESHIMEPIKIEHQGQVLTRQDILRLTAYQHGENAGCCCPMGRQHNAKTGGETTTASPPGLTHELSP